MFCKFRKEYSHIIIKDFGDGKYVFNRASVLN